MREITWFDAIKIAERRQNRAHPGHPATQPPSHPVFVIFNGKRGDFDSLRSLGMVGQMKQDENGVWYVNTAYSHHYLHDNSTVWV